MLALYVSTKTLYTIKKTNIIQLTNLEILVQTRTYPLKNRPVRQSLSG